MVRHNYVSNMYVHASASGASSHCIFFCRNEIANDEIAPIIPATITEEPWSPRNYTNVAFARATAQGQSTSPHTPLKNGRAKKNRM